MKIIQIIARLNVGGSTSQVVWLTKKLTNKDLSSVLIAGTVPAGEEDMAYFAVENGVEPIYIPELSRELSPNDAVALFKIFRELQRQKPDIIHTHTAKAGAIGRIAAFLYRWLTWRTLMGKPRPLMVVHTFHGHVFHSYYGPLKTSFFINIERVLAKLVTTRIVVITDQQFREIHGDFGVGSADQFRVIPYGIDLSEFAGNDGRRRILRDEIKADDDEIVIGFLGRLTEIKNLPLLLDAADLYNHHEGTDKPAFRFAIIGDGNLRAELETRAAALGLENIVHFLGNRKNVADLIAGTDIVAITSHNEGTPLSLIEAMAAGKPVISTAVGGVVDLLGKVKEQFDGFAVCERGISVEPNVPESFLAGLIHMAGDQKLLAEIAASGERFATETYSLERLEKDMISLYGQGS